MPLFRKGSGSSKGGAPPPYSEPEGLYVAQPVHGEPPVYDSTALYTAKEPTPKNQGLGVLLKMEPGPIRDGRPETMCVIHDIRKGSPAWEHEQIRIGMRIEQINHQELSCLPQAEVLRVQQSVRMNRHVQLMLSERAGPDGPHAWAPPIEVMLDLGADEAADTAEEPAPFGCDCWQWPSRSRCKIAGRGGLIQEVDLRRPNVQPDLPFIIAEHAVQWQLTHAAKPMPHWNKLSHIVRDAIRTEAPPAERLDSSVASRIRKSWAESAPIKTTWVPHLGCSDSQTEPGLGEFIFSKIQGRFVAVLDTQVTVGLEPPRVLLGCQHMCTMLESLLPAVRTFAFVGPRWKWDLDIALRQASIRSGLGKQGSGTAFIWTLGIKPSAPPMPTEIYRLDDTASTMTTADDASSGSTSDDSVADIDIEPRTDALPAAHPSGRRRSSSTGQPSALPTADSFTSISSEMPPPSPPTPPGLERSSSTASNASIKQTLYDMATLPVKATMASVSYLSPQKWSPHKWFAGSPDSSAGSANERPEV